MSLISLEPVKSVESAEPVEGGVTDEHVEHDILFERVETEEQSAHVEPYEQVEHTEPVETEQYIEHYEPAKHIEYMEIDDVELSKHVESDDVKIDQHIESCEPDELDGHIEPDETDGHDEPPEHVESEEIDMYVKPDEPTEHINIYEHVKCDEIVESVETDDNVASNEPVETDEQTEHVESGDTNGHVEIVETDKHIEHVKSVETDEQIEPSETDSHVEIIERDQHIESNKTGGHDEPVEHVESEEIHMHVEHDEPAEHMEVYEHVKPNEIVESVETDDNVASGVPVETDEHVAYNKPVKTDEEIETDSHVETGEHIAPHKTDGHDKSPEDVESEETDMRVEPYMPVEHMNIYEHVKRDEIVESVETDKNIASNEPVETDEQIDPALHVEPGETDSHVDIMETEEHIDQVEHVKPIETDEHIELAEHVEPDDHIELVETDEQIETGGHDKLAEKPVLTVEAEQEAIGPSDTSYKVENSEQRTNFPLAGISNDNNAICYVNQDNTLSFINNRSVFQTVEDDCGEIYYACIGTNNSISQQSQVLQLIPQTQLSNYIISDKDYSSVNFVSNPTILNGSSFYPIPTSEFQVPKYQFDNVDSNVFKSINGIGKQICEICSMEFPSKRTYLKHMSIHENDREFKCSWCKLSYNYEVNLLVHIAIIHSNECTIINENTQEINYKCGICSCLFSRKKAHQAHCLIHQVDEELPCDHCSTLFKCKILLEKHLVDHKIGNECADEKLATNYLNCKICHQVFDNVGNIKKHYAQFHPKIKEQWVEDILSTKIEETTPPDIAENTEEVPNKRRSSKIASQTIKLYAMSKSKCTQTKQDTMKSLSKRGRPKKSESKSSRNSSSCMLCLKTFKTPILLRRHEVTHTGVKEFQCAICKKGFTQKSSVKIHMAVHEAEKGFSCEFCGKRFTYEHNMNTHIKVIHKDGNSAPIPPMDIPKSSIARIHPNETHVEILECRAENEEPVVVKADTSIGVIVNASMTDDAEISQYLWNESQAEHSVSENISYQPNQSNFAQADGDKSQRATENRGILVSKDIERIDKATGQVQIHQVVTDQVTGFKRYRCRFCFKLYRNSFDLTRHVRIHGHVRPFQCYMCHKSFRLKSVLKNHFKSHWKLKEYSCGQCNKIFNLKQTLKVHQRLHNPEKMKYSCKLCDKRFNTAFHYRYHIKNTHRTAPAATVEIAPNEESQNDPSKTVDSTKTPLRTFVWNDLLNQPEPISDPDKKPGNSLFKCNHCGKSYKFKKYLNEHLKDHMSSNKTNICHFCNKTFLTFRSMQQHLRTQHLNRRKFSCSQCPAFFLTKASLIRHGLVHSNSKPYACSLCLRRFKAKIYCDRHIASKKCSKKMRLPNSTGKVGNNQATAMFNLSQEGNAVAIHPVESDILANDQLDPFSSFRLEDLDMTNAQSSNILVTNYVNQFGSFPNSDKYMLVSLDNQHEKGHHTNDINQNAYFTSNMLIEDPSLVDMNRNPGENNGDASENIMGLLEGQIGVTPIDIGSIFTVQNYTGNIGAISAHLVDRNAQGADMDYTQSGENIYYYQAVNEIPTECHEPIKGSLADKFPILKASLFSDEEPNTKPRARARATRPAKNTKAVHNRVNQFIVAAVNPSESVPFAHRTYSDPSQPKFYHGCANCDQQFKDSAALVQHVKFQHKIRKDYVCNVCHKAFSAKLSLWAHSKTHIDSRSFGCFVCIACNQRFISVPSLSRHVRMQHNDNLNLYRCTHCGKVYKTTRELDSHVKQLLSEYDALIINANLIENREANDMVVPKTKVDIDVDIDKVYFSGLNSSQIDHIASLDVCNASKLSLKELIKVAKDTKSKIPTMMNQSKIAATLTFPYSCSICHKGFNRASNLQQHLSVHTKMKPFQCSKCNHQFRHRCSLKTHETTKHNPVTKLLRCHLCLKFLRSHVALRNHMKIHVRSYPFNCDSCEKGFQDSEQLKKHVKLKHRKSELVAIAPAPEKVVSSAATTYETAIATDTTFTADAASTTVSAAIATPTTAAKSTKPVSATTTSTPAKTSKAFSANTTTPGNTSKSFSANTTTPANTNKSFSASTTTPVNTSKSFSASTTTPANTNKSFSANTSKSFSATSTPTTAKTANATSTPTATTAPNAPRTSMKLTATLVNLDSPPPKKGTVPEIPKKLIKCLSCSFIFNTKETYDSHYCARLNSLKPDDGTAPNTCCNITFESKSHLLRHIQNVHRQIVQYNCAQCNIMFAQESSYRNHQKSVHHL